ncbi:MAG: hypothetical protein N2662_08980 [Bacteroidales bacterium]|nr:hypothetical protein [Bacteroidales bacterium]
MRTFVFIISIMLIGGYSLGQEYSLTLNQLIDSALYNRADFRIERLIKQQQLLKNSGSPFLSTELSIRNGYLYSTAREQEIRFRQELGTPAQWFGNVELKNQLDVKYSNDSIIKAKQLIAHVKQSYFLCVYRYALYRHYQKVMELINRLGKEIPFDSLDNEITLLYSEWLLKLQDSYYDWLDAQNELRYASGLSVIPIPVDSVPELYQIEPAPDTSTRTPARLFYNAYLAQIRYNNEYIRNLRYAHWPALFIDLSVRSNENRKNYMAWQIGFRIPLESLFTSNQSDLLVVENKKAEYQWLKQKSEIDYRSERIIIQMNKCFARVNFYRNNTLPQVEKETYQIINQVLDNEKKMQEVLKSIISWQKYYLEYLNSIYEYNSLAAELEILAY